MSDVYHWQDEAGAWQLARLASFVPSLTPYTGRTRRYINDGYEYLVQHLYSNRLEWVPADKLKPYPSEPIPEPQARQSHGWTCEECGKRVEYFVELAQVYEGGRILSFHCRCYDQWSEKRRKAKGAK